MWPLRQLKNNFRGQPASPSLTDPNNLGPGWRLRERLVATATSEIFLLDGRRGARAVGKRLLPGIAARHPSYLSREYSVLRRFAHEAVVRALDHVESDTGEWLVLEYLQYGDLRSLAGAPPSFWLPLLLGPVGWLAGLHAQGMVYGDLKLSHLMLRHPSHACVVDLGTLTAVGKRLSGSTPGAVPPEASSFATTNADVYAVGVLLHELVTGALPSSSAWKRAAWSTDQTALLEMAAQCRDAAPESRPQMESIHQRLGAIVECGWVAARSGS